MPKLNIENQSRVRAYLQNLSTIYGVHIICQVCMECLEWTGVKDGEGQYGISHGLCPACLEAYRDRVKLSG